MGDILDNAGWELTKIHLLHHLPVPQDEELGGLLELLGPVEIPEQVHLHHVFGGHLLDFSLQKDPKKLISHSSVKFVKLQKCT